MPVKPQTDSAFQESEYTPEMIRELKRCRADPIYFIETHIKVQHPTKGTVPMVLYKYQKEMFLAIHNKDTVINACVRQAASVHYHIVNTHPEKMTKARNATSHKSMPENQSFSFLRALMEVKS